METQLHENGTSKFLKSLVMWIMRMYYFHEFFLLLEKIILLSLIFSPKSPTNGCLQYQTGLTGRIKTFNFDSTGTAQQHLASQFYASCIRLRQGFCCVQYQVWILNFPALFPPANFWIVSFKNRSVQMTDHFHLTIMVQWILCLPWLVWVFPPFFKIPFF